MVVGQSEDPGEQARCFGWAASLVGQLAQPKHNPSPVLAGFHCDGAAPSDWSSPRPRKRSWTEVKATEWVVTSVVAEVGCDN